MSEPTPPICNAYYLVAELGLALDAGPLTKHPACWECQIDRLWRIAINGHNAPKRCSFAEVPIEPYHCYIEFNGWPAGIMTPFGGTIAAGSVANEETFMQALRERIAKERAL